MRIFGLDISWRAKGAVPAGTGMPITSGGWGWLRETFAGAWQRGVTVDGTESVLAFAAVFACISRIASDIAKLRFMLVQLDNGIWNEVTAPSPFWTVLRKPNAYQTRIQFFMAWMISKLVYGNTYVLKIRNDARGMVTELHVLHPKLVTPLVAPDGSVYYRLGADLLAEKPLGATVPASEIIHDRGMTLFHPLVGVSPIFACGAAATQGNRIQGNSAKFFENMSRPSGMLTAPSTITDETATRLKREWEENFSGSNIGRMAVLGDGLKYEAMTITADDAQLIEQLKWTGEDAARAFGVPGYKIGVGPIPTNNNVEALEQQYYSGTLQSQIESIEILLVEGIEVSSGMGIEADLDGLLRMDTAALYESLGKVVTTGIMAPDEARAKLNLKPVPGGATPYMQQQNWSLAQLDRRDIVADKPAVAAPAGTAAPGAAAGDEPPPAGKALLEHVEKTTARIESLAESLDAASARSAAADAGVQSMLEAAIAGIPVAIEAAVAQRAAQAETEDPDEGMDADAVELCKAGIMSIWRETLNASS